MNEVEGTRRWEEGPRVRVRTRVVRRSDAGRPPTEGLRADLREAERRFLSLPSGASEGLSAETMSECLSILTALRGISDQLQEMAGRRDLSYLADRRLTAMHDHCAWLASRVSAEFLLLLQIALERELRRVISPEAYQLYLRLEDVEEVAREVEALTGPSILARLRDGTLMREMLGRVWPAQIPAET